MTTLSTATGNNQQQQQHDCIVFLTDLEPDDVMAFGLLKNSIIKASSPDMPVLMVVGTGKHNKVGMARGMCAWLERPDIQIIQGDFSTKDYPEDALRVFAKYADPANCADDPDVTLESFLAKHSNPMVWCLKPMSELIPCRQHLSKCTLYVYGSFNFRSLSNASAEKRKMLSDLVNGAFREVFLYESFLATGPRNSITSENAPAIFEKLRPELVALIHAWGQHVAVDCLETLHSSSSAMIQEWPEQKWPALNKRVQKMKRNLKVLENVVEASNLQMVLADFALVAAVLQMWKGDEAHAVGDVTRGSISFNDFGYTVHVAEASGRVNLFSNVDWNKLVAAIAAHL